jgi:hypothetical protein
MQFYRQMILSKIPKDLDTYSIQVDSNSNVVRRYTQREMDQLFVSMIPLVQTHAIANREFQKVCRGKLCCEWFIKYTTYDTQASQFGYSYRLSIRAGGSGEQISDIDEGDSQEMHCAIVACTEESTERCGSRFLPSDSVRPSVRFEEIHITMSLELDDLEDEDLMAMPTNVDFRLLPLPATAFAFAASELFNENK